LPELALELDGCGWLVTALACVVAWPWNERAAATEIRPDSATAPAIIHLLIRAIRFSPASRAVIALGVISVAR
jgi:hypothetical protein